MTHFHTYYLYAPSPDSIDDKYVPTIFTPEFSVISRIELESPGCPSACRYIVLLTSIGAPSPRRASCQLDRSSSSPYRSAAFCRRASRSGSLCVTDSSAITRSSRVIYIYSSDPLAAIAHGWRTLATGERAMGLHYPVRRGGATCNAGGRTRVMRLDSPLVAPHRRTLPSSLYRFHRREHVEASQGVFSPVAGTQQGPLARAR